MVVRLFVGGGARGCCCCCCCRGEIVRIRRMGYPVHKTWDEMWQMCVREEYWVAARVRADAAELDGSKAASVAVLSAALEPGDWQAGLARAVSMRYHGTP